jgi:hypothetical protein
MVRFVVLACPTLCFLDSRLDLPLGATPASPGTGARRRCPSAAGMATTATNLLSVRMRALQIGGAAMGESRCEIKSPSRAPH